MQEKIQEYLDCTSNLRHYSNHHAALLTAHVAINGCIATLVFGKDTLLGCYEDLGAKFFALGISILFAMMIVSAMFMYDHFLRRTAELEREIAFEQYRRLPGYPRFRIRPAKWAIYLFILFTVLFWILAIVYRW